MLEEVKSMLIARYGDRWLNNINNQNGIAEDLSIFEKDLTRVSRKFGIVGRGLFISSETEIIARYEVICVVKSLFEVDGLFYHWWGNRASENMSYVEREIGDDEIIYHFITGSPTHGHSGRIIFTGKKIKMLLQQRWQRRLEQLDLMETVITEESISVDHCAG